MKTVSSIILLLIVPAFAVLAQQMSGPIQNPYCRLTNSFLIFGNMKDNAVLEVYLWDEKETNWVGYVQDGLEFGVVSTNHMADLTYRDEKTTVKLKTDYSDKAVWRKVPPPAPDLKYFWHEFQNEEYRSQSVTNGILR